jgi:hypothetical protein
VGDHFENLQTRVGLGIEDSGGGAALSATVHAAGDQGET